MQVGCGRDFLAVCLLQRLQLQLSIVSILLDSCLPMLSYMRRAAGFTVITEGDVGNKFYIIKEGEATVLQEGREVNRLFRSDFFGEQALLKDEPR